MPDDPRDDKQVQVSLKHFPKKHQHDCKQTFSANWYNERDWLEYSGQPFAFTVGNLERVTHKSLSFHKNWF